MQHRSCSSCSRLAAYSFALISLGLNSALAQHLVSWGNDGGGVVSSTPTDSGYVKVATGLAFTLALRADGSLYAWGQDFNGEVSNLPAGSNFVDIAVSWTTALAVRADGTLEVWGDDDEGLISQAPAGNDFVKVSGGGISAAMALRSDGSIEAWGSDPYGIVSDVPAGTGFTAIANASQHAVALRSDGSIQAWGRDDHGQVSDTPAGVGYLQVEASGGNSIALRADGSIAVWGWEPLLVTAAPTGSGFVHVGAGAQTMMALAADGSLTIWGSDHQGLISLAPGGTGYLDVSASGWGHAVAIRSGNTPTFPIHNVSASPVTTHADLQSAIDQASEGDTLLVGEGQYSGFEIQGKSLSIIATDGGAWINGVSGGSSVVVSNLGANQRVVLSGISFVTPPQAQFTVRLSLNDNQGFVYVQDSNFLMSEDDWMDFNCWEQPGISGATVVNCANVTFSNCGFRGGGGNFGDSYCDEKIGMESAPGGAGLSCVDSRVTLAQCTLLGGEGGGPSPTGTAAGGPGLELVNSSVYLLGSSSRGGITGANGPPSPVPGGPGVVADASSVLHHKDSFLEGGLGGPPGPAITGLGVENPIPGLAPELQIDPLMGWSAPSDATILGEVGDRVFLLSSFDPKNRWLLPLGVQHLTVSLPLPPMVGVVGGSGSLVAPPNFSHLSVSLAPGPVAVQAFSLAADGKRHLSGVRHVLAFDEVSLPDCNGNGVNDYVDILTGASADADQNLIPDECGG